MKNLISFRYILSFFLISQACSQHSKVQSPSRFLNQTSIPSEDWIQCKQTTENFRRFCKIRENEQIVTKVLSIQGNISPGQELLLNGIFSAGRFEDKPQNSGLQPHVKFSLDWDGSTECWKSGLTNPDMQIHINGNKVGLAITHVRDYSFPLRSWNFSKIGEEVQISVPFKFMDAQGQREDPNRYPLQCKMVVSDLRIDFDAVQVRKSLNVLKSVAESTSINLTLTTILHNKILNQSRNLTCLLSKTMDNLKLGENVRNYEELSLGSKTMLVSSTESLAGLGAIFLGPLSADDWLRKNSNSLPDGQSPKCLQFDPQSLKPDPQKFKSHEKEGIENAHRYLKARNTLNEILATAELYKKFSAESESYFRDEGTWLNVANALLN